MTLHSKREIQTDFGMHQMILTVDYIDITFFFLLLFIFYTLVLVGQQFPTRLIGVYEVGHWCPGSSGVKPVEDPETDLRNPRWVLL